MRVTETIHHGDYYNVRTVDMEPTFAGLVAVLQASPYAAGWTFEDYARNKYVARLLADLLTAGCGELGWARYEVQTSACDRFGHNFVNGVCRDCGATDTGSGSFAGTEREEK